MPQRKETHILVPIRATDEGETFTLIGLAYDAVGLPEGWEVFVDRLAEVMGGAAVVLTLPFMRSHRAGSVVTAGVTADFHRAYVDRYQASDPWATALTGRPAGSVGFGYETLPRPLLVGGPFYNEWMRPQGLPPTPTIHGVVFADQQRPVSTIAIFRRERSRTLEIEDLMQMRAIMPHLARAVALAHEQRGLAFERDVAAATLSVLPHAVLLVDERGKVLMTNRAAARMVARNDGLQLSDSQLRAASVTDDTRLHQVIAAVAQAEAVPAIADTIVIVARPSGRPPLSVRVTPVHTIGVDSGGESVVAIVVNDSESQTAELAERVRQRFGLTPSEAAIAALLAAGYAARQIAEQRGIALDTVRRHLRQIFAKTGTTGKAALVRRLVDAS